MQDGETYSSDEPTEVIGKTPQVGQEHVCEMRRDEVIRQTRFDDTDHLIGEPSSIEGGTEELIILFFHRISHLRADFRRANDRSTNTGSVVTEVRCVRE